MPTTPRSTAPPTNLTTLTPARQLRRQPDGADDTELDSPDDGADDADDTALDSPDDNPLDSPADNLTTPTTARGRTERGDGRACRPGRVLRAAG
jgi:hypothetical protein